MFWKQLFAKKSLEMLHAEAMGDNRLRRVLGPVALTSLGIGAIIGAGIFVMTGRVAAEDAGPAIVVSFIVAGFACALAAFCYSEFASMAPVAGSAYTYAYATLGELLAWIIGWDLILEYAMSAATVAAHWAKYLNEFLRVCFGPQWVVPDYLCNDPFSHPGAIMNLPAVLILGVVTTILVIGIRESAASNTALVALKLGVVLFVIVVGAGFINLAYYTDIPYKDRKLNQDLQLPKASAAYVQKEQQIYKLAQELVQEDAATDPVKQVVVKPKKGAVLTVRAIKDKDDAEKLSEQLAQQAIAQFRIDLAEKDGDPDFLARTRKTYENNLPTTPEQKRIVAGLLLKVEKGTSEAEIGKWGMMAQLGINRSLAQVDDAVRSNYFPYGLSGMMLGAALVFFAFIGFDSISTHSEEAIRPQRDVPIGILTSLFVCTLLYVLVSAVITGMEPYPKIDPEAAVASAFRQRAARPGGGPLLNASAGLIAAGALAGMTSVLLITFLSQARIFLAMARDNLLPHAIFGVVHPRFRTPHISTMLTGALMCVVAGFTPIRVLEEMVNIGTLFAFVIVCAAVLILRIKRPDAPRPFRCPALFIVAPLGIAVNLILMLFLPVDTWLRLVIWMGIGLVIYFTYGIRHSSLGKQLRGNGPATVQPHAAEAIKPAASE